jgi:hypothetical protein
MPDKQEPTKKPEDREKRPGRAIEDLPQKEASRESTERVKGGFQESPDRLQAE